VPIKSWPTNAVTCWAVCDSRNTQYLSTLPTDRTLSGQTCSTSDCTGSSSNTCPTNSCSLPATPPSSCSTEQATFINNMLTYAKTASAQTGLPVNFILGHWGLETGWGTGGGLCDSCNNPGNLVNSTPCSCTPSVGSYVSLTDGVDAYTKWTYDHYGLKEACMAIGAGCEPGSGYSQNIYATGRYDGVSCNNMAVSNNCYL
jgi:hypothetical protein